MVKNNLSPINYQPLIIKTREIKKKWSIGTRPQLTPIDHKKIKKTLEK